MINITDKSQCCGCNACGDICPKGSISFKTDIEGFSYPIVNAETCIDCHLCEKICPIIQVTTIKKDQFSSPKCYAAQCKNLQSLFDSTSGSAFATLAESMYKKGGYVGGAIFNSDYSVTQFISSNKADLALLRHSKYVQSDSQGFYKQIRDLLNSGEKVLVCGLPCQMAGVRSFLGKDYDNLIIVDLICLGINSPKLLRAYLDYMEDKHRSKIIYYEAKNKELGWRQLTTKIVFENGDVEYDKKDTNYFTNGFIKTHAFARPSCYSCQFKGFPRLADLTIGDLWGAERIVGKEYDHDLGTSVIIANTQKGLNFLNDASFSFRITEISLAEVIKGNSPLITPLTKSLMNRDKLFDDLRNLKFQDFAHKYIQLPCEQRKSYKTIVKNIIRFLYHTAKASRINPILWLKNLYYNLFCTFVHTNILNGQYIIINKYCVLDLSKKSQIHINGQVNFGTKRIRGSRLETRLLVEKAATLTLGGGSIAYGADIEVFSGAKLEIGKNAIFNLNTTIICAESITIGDDVQFGRDVTIRDNNGGHFISRRMYKDKRPIFIGQHSWICEQALVMPGTKLGVGVIAGARSVVSGKYKNFTLISGSPAEVVDEDVYWKA